jgi:uncharacterized protein (TIGR03437 family)
VAHRHAYGPQSTTRYLPIDGSNAVDIGPPSAPRIPKMPNHHSAIAVMALLLAFRAYPARSAEAPPTGFATTLRYADFGAFGTARQVLTDRSGNVVVVGMIVNRMTVSRPDTSIAVTKLDNTGHVLFRFVFGGTGYNDPRGAAMDAAGNIYIGGMTAADDFPLVNALISKTAPKVDAGFVAKLDTTGSHLVFSTRIGGIASGTGPNSFQGTDVNALALDGQNNIYLAGTTYALDFPTTAGAFQTQSTAQLSQLLTSTVSYAFVLKLSSTGDRLLFSTLLGGSAKNCSGGSACIGVGVDNVGLTIAVDNSGQTTVAGYTTSPSFSVTSGAFQTQCRCEFGAPAAGPSTGFISRLSPTGTALVWSTFLGGSIRADPGRVLFGGGEVSALALDGSGNVFVAGDSASIDFPVTPGALVPAVQSLPLTGFPYVRIQHGFATKMNTSGTALLYSTYLAGKGEETVSAIVPDSQGHVWLTGTTTSPDFPSLPGSLSLGNEFLIELETDASRLLQSYRLPTGSSSQGVLVSSPRNVLTLGSSGEVLDWFFGDTSGPSLVGVANAAATSVSGRVAPGEIVSIYGVRLGPTPGVGARLDADGRVATSLAGVQVLFGGTPAPLVYVSDTQINAIAPFEIAGNASTTVQVVTPSGSPPPLNLTVVAADPSLFRSPTGTVAALNQDGTINSPTNPAHLGSVISLYANGAGLLDPPPVDGSITGTTLPKPTLHVSVTFDTVPAEILYAAAAPSLVAGVLQINVRIPTHSTPSIQLQVGSAVSERTPISLAP